MIMEEPLLIYKKKEIRKKMLALRRALSTDETDKMAMYLRCLLYTSDAADERSFLCRNIKRPTALWLF